MKFCPTCETRYDEEILRFCTKDGTPLIDEDQPNFTELPSQSSIAEDDLGEETMVSYKPRKDLLEPEPQPEPERTSEPRIVISTNESRRDQQQQVRNRQIPPYQPLPQKQNTAKVVLLTILGTLAVLAMVLGLFVFFRNEEPANINLNINTNPPNTNFNTNLNVGASNFNFNVNTNLNTNLNTNFNVNLNTNFNANLKTPTPKPSPSANVNANVGNINTNSATPTPVTPSETPTPRLSPTPSRSETPVRTPTPSPASRPSNNSNNN